MDENYNELTFRDIWYKYLIPFFKWFGRSIKKTFTSKRLIAIVAITILVPLIAWGVFELQTKKVIEENMLLKSEAVFLLDVDFSKISVPVDEKGNPSVSRESYALTVAKEQITKYNDIIIGERILNQLYNDVEVKNNASCLYENLNSYFDQLYFGEKSVNGIITRDYFVWTIGNYLVVRNKGAGSFNIEVISNRARYFSDYLESKDTPKTPTTDYEKNQLNIRKLWPLLSYNLMNAINSALPGIILDEENGLLSMMDTVTEIEEDGTPIQVNFIKGLKLVSSPITYAVSNPNFIMEVEFTLKNGINWTIGGFFIGIGLFLIIDMIIAIIEGDRKYRGVTVEKKTPKDKTIKAQE